MNIICTTCNARNSGWCAGRDGNFKYCFQGCTSDFDNIITPFNTTDELYDKCSWLHWVIKDSLEFGRSDYGNAHTVLLYGRYRDLLLETEETIPVGYVTK